MVTSLLTKGGAALLLPVYTRYLVPAEYATFSNLMAIAGVISLFLSLHVDYAYGRLFFDVANDARVRQLFSTLFFFVVTWGGVVALLAYIILRESISAFLKVPAWPYIALACVIPLLMQFGALAAAHFRCRHRSRVVSLVRLLGFLVGALVSILFLVTFKQGSLALLLGALASSGFASVTYLVILAHEGLLRLEFSWHLLRDSLLYAIGLFPMTVSGWIVGQVDRLLITWFVSLNDSGIYSVAFEVGRVMNLFVISLFMAYSPMVFAMLKEDGQKNIARIEQFQAFYLHVLVGLAFFVSVFAPEIFLVLVEEKYHGGIVMVPVISFAFVFGGIRKLHATVILYHKLTWLVSIGGMVQAGLCLALNFLLIPHFGGMAAAWTKLCSSALVAAYFYFLTRKYQPVRFDFKALKVTLGTLIMCLSVLGVSIFVIQLSFWPLVGVKIAMIMLAVAITWRSSFGLGFQRTFLKSGKTEI